MLYAFIDMILSKVTKQPEKYKKKTSPLNKKGEL